MDDQMVGAGQGALAGAGAGASIGGPWGAAAGAVAGGVLGFMGSDKKGYSIPWDQYRDRLNQISSYSAALSGATANYKAALGNMYNTAFNQYMPNIAAQFAGRGLNIDSGAFASELAKKSAELTSEGMVSAAGMDIGNLDKVDKAYGNAWGEMFGAANSSNKAGFDNANANMAGLASGAVGIGKLGLMNRYQPNGHPPGNPFSESEVDTMSRQQWNDGAGNVW